MNVPTVILLAVGTLTWSLTMIKSGLNYDFGLGFWGANGHDSIWHLSLSAALQSGKLDLPIFASEQIKNYHLGFNFLLAAAAQITGIPPINLYFQLIPPLLALSIGWLTYRFVKSHTGSTTDAFWSVFFVYFGTSLAWLIGRHESFFWAQQSLSTLINPPYALSLPILLLIFHCVRHQRYLKLGFLAALIIQLKVYAGILVFIGLLSLLLLDRKAIKSLLTAGLLGIPLFLLFNSSSPGLIVFHPLWFVENLFTPDRLSSEYLRSAISTFKSSQAWLKLAPLYLLGLSLFIVGNLGFRLIGFVQLFKHSNQTFNLFSLAIILSGIVIPLLFVQKGTAWNTIQFVYYVQFVLAIFSGIAVSRLLIKHQSWPLKISISAAVILLHIPPTVDTLGHYLPSRPPAKLTRSELEALRHLKSLPNGVVLTQPFNRQLADQALNSPPRPLSLYESTAYVSAFSGQTVYLEDEVNLDILGVDWRPRKKIVETFFSTTDSAWQRQFVKSENIKYLYVTKDLPSPRSLPPHQILFENANSVIYQMQY